MADEFLLNQFDGALRSGDLKAVCRGNSPGRSMSSSQGNALRGGDSRANVYYYLADDLGTSSVVTSATGLILDDSDVWPFGAEHTVVSGRGNNDKLTSYERDAESGNDYAMFRTHVNRLGRFNAPDRLSGSIGDPQSLNRFVYARNDPVNFLDPLGLYWECVQTTISGIEQPEICRWVDDPIIMAIPRHPIFYTVVMYDDLTKPDGG